MKHTPSPWKVNVYETKNATNPRQVTVIARGMTIRVSGLDQQREANAHLIAAAPDLLAACEEAREWIGDVPEGDGGYYFGLRQVVRVLDAAIAAAKGEVSIPELVAPCEMCGTDVYDAKNLHNALAHDGNTYQVCDDCAHQHHRWQEVS